MPLGSMNDIFTVGHSTHASSYFIELLAENAITAVADVRSSPFSRFNPQFNQVVLTNSLREYNIKYVFLGEELGARSKDPGCYIDGKVQYDKLAQTSAFKSGIARLLEGAEKFRIALMCAEKDPLTCHRAILVSKVLAEQSVEVNHILPDGNLETHSQLVERMLRKWSLQGDDMFSLKENRVQEAYRLQGDLIAYEDESSLDSEGRLINQVREKQA